MLGNNLLDGSAKGASGSTGSDILSAAEAVARSTASRRLVLAVIATLLTACAGSTPPPALLRGTTFAVPLSGGSGAPTATYKVSKAILNQTLDNPKEIESGSPLGQEMLDLAHNAAEQLKPVLANAPGQPVTVDIAFEETLTNHAGTNFSRNFAVGFLTLGLANGLVPKSLSDEETITFTVTRVGKPPKTYSASAKKDFEDDQGGKVWAQERVALRQDCVRQIVAKMRTDLPGG